MNDAIARRDLGAIGILLLPTYHVVTVRSMQRDGSEAAVRGWADLFNRDAGATHTLITEEIHLNEEWGMAHEHGRWTATVTTRDGLIEIGGVYAAKWHLTAGGWLLQAEIFTPLAVETGTSSGG